MQGTGTQCSSRLHIDTWLVLVVGARLTRGRCAQALNIYKELLALDDPDPLYYIYAAACYYYMGLYKEAEAAALQVCVAVGVQDL